jgi:hypothetical protein
MKVADVSGGGGPKVSSTITRAKGRTRGAVVSGGALGTAGWRAPQAPMVAAKTVRQSQVATPAGTRDIARITPVRRER